MSVTVEGKSLLIVVGRLGRNSLLGMHMLPQRRYVSRADVGRCIYISHDQDHGARLEVCQLYSFAAPLTSRPVWYPWK